MSMGPLGGVVGSAAGTEKANIGRFRYVSENRRQSAIELLDANRYTRAPGIRITN